MKKVHLCLPLSLDLCIVPMKYQFLSGLILALAVFSTNLGSGWAESDETKILFFENEIRPLLAAHCFKCHGAKKQESELALHTGEALRRGGLQGEAIVPGNPDESLLIQSIRRTGDLKMPPEKALAQDQIAVLEKWVALGAPFPAASGDNTSITIRSGEITAHEQAFWSFQPIRDPEPPAIDETSIAHNPIDHFVLARLKETPVKASKPADKRTLIRRATFDLTGLPPTPIEVDEFLGNTSPQAFEQLVARLLRKPAYGERWGRHWLDVVRYADTAGETGDFPVREAYLYRNYVVQAFNIDKPYDAFIREQVAGDILAEQLVAEQIQHDGKPGPEGFDPILSDATIFGNEVLSNRFRELVTATGYLAISRRFGYNAQNHQYLTIQDTIDTLGQSLLGLSLGCARCHDHKYDPVNKADYYAWYGIFDSTTYAQSGSEGNNRPQDMTPLIPLEVAHNRKAAFDLEVKRVSDELARLSARRIKLEEDLKPYARLFVDDSPEEPGWNPFLSDVNARLFTDFIPNESGHEGFHVFRPSGRGIPMLAVNTTEEVIRVPGIVPAKGVCVHPDTNDGIALAWRSPLTGTVRLRGSVRDIHDCGDSIRWHLDHLATSGFKALADGQPGRNGTQMIGASAEAAAGSLELQVRKGDILQLAIFMNGDLGCDLTHIDLQIDSLEKEPQSWNLAKDVVGDLHEGGDGNPHSDQYGNEDTWFFFATQENLREAWAKADVLSDEELTHSREHAFQLKDELDQTVTTLSKLTTHQQLMNDNGPYQAVYGVVEGEAQNANIHVRGNHLELGDEVPRRNLEILGSELVPLGDQSGRLLLADWLTRKENPLTARVMANRIWQHHFGHGLVRTENDFGVRGQLPTHPELLDWLASRFIESGWSIKAMHQLIMTSATYQQSSRSDGQAMELDREVKLLWKFNRRRLSAEEIRDSLLFVSGDLDPSVGEEHPFPPVSSWNFTQHGPFYGLYETNRRSIYLMQQRLKRHPFLALFDGADPNVSTAKRTLTTVPTQTLFLMNDPFVHDRSRSLANRLLNLYPEDANEQIRAAYRATLLRNPAGDELNSSRDFVGRYAASLEENDPTSDESTIHVLSALVRTLFVRNEFLFVD